MERFPLDDVRIPNEGSRSAVHLLGMLLSRALGSGAVEVMIETGKGGCHVRYRVGDDWSELEQFPAKIGESLVNELRRRSLMELSKSYFGLEGVVPVLWKGRPLDLYWETVSAQNGEVHILRLSADPR